MEMAWGHAEELKYDSGSHHSTNISITYINRQKTDCMRRHALPATASR